jgi:hypothetical protein
MWHTRGTFGVKDMTPRRKQSWTIGNVLGIPLLDGSYVLAQIVGREPGALNSVSCALFDYVFKDPEEMPDCELLMPERAFAVLFVTRDLLDSHRWRVSGHCEVRIPRELLPFEHLRASDFVGACVIGSGIVESFANGFYGLSPWNDMHDPHYFDKLLLHQDVGPKKKLLTRSGATAGIKGNVHS